MPCTLKYRSEEAMAEQGWSVDEIKQLQLEVQLAQAEANKQGYDLGLTRTQQRQLEQMAIDKALVVAHDRFHAKLAAFMESLPKGDAVHVHAHALGPAEREKLAKLLEGG